MGTRGTGKGKEIAGSLNGWVFLDEGIHRRWPEKIGNSRGGFAFFKVLTQLRVYVDDCRCMA
jgi:hypothetical protein